MTTATAPAPITEADVRAAIAAREAKFPHDNWSDKLDQATGQVSDPIGYFDDEGFLSDIWTDLRPSEQERLNSLLADAVGAAYVRAKAVILEEVVGAALAFAAECPDARRAVR